MKSYAYIAKIDMFKQIKMDDMLLKYKLFILVIQ